MEKFLLLVHLLQSAAQNFIINWAPFCCIISRFLSRTGHVFCDLECCCFGVVMMSVNVYTLMTLRKIEGHRSLDFFLKTCWMCLKRRGTWTIGSAMCPLRKKNWYLA